jgi:hypothetical protein
METAVIENQIKNETGRQRSLANLRPAQKGEIRNPNGRPARITCVSSLLAELIKGDAVKVKDKWDKETKGHPTGGMLIAMAMFKKMANGDLTACKEGLDRVEGKVTEHIDTTSKGESLNHTTVEVVSDKAKEATEIILSGKIEQCVN